MDRLQFINDQLASGFELQWVIFQLVDDLPAEFDHAAYADLCSMMMGA